MSDLLLPTALFWILFIADWYKTSKGLLPDVSNEGNPVTGYLYRKAPRWLFHRIHILYGIAITILILLGGRFGLWIGYSTAIYNFIGYLSWTRLNRQKERTNRLYWTPILLVAALISGYLLISLHELVWVR